jgi:hypothetical protein
VCSSDLLRVAHVTSTLPTRGLAMLLLTTGN